MADATPPTNPNVQTNNELEDLDKLLLEMDPKFATEIAAMKKVESAADVQIESSVVADDFAAEEAPVVEAPKTWRQRLRIKERVLGLSRRILISTLMFLKTVPKELLLYAWSNLKQIAKVLKSALTTVSHLPRSQKIGILILGGMLALTGWLIKANLRGKWLPAMYSPILSEFASHADATFDFNPRTDMIPFFKAFPQDPEIFLFQKIKVNLRRGDDHPNPMGAFEIYVQVDSHDTAIEVQTRQVELHDMIQRVIEGQSYTELVSELGKNRLKGLLKKEIDHALTQGWVSDIHYKTFILKP